MQANLEENIKQLDKEKESWILTEVVNFALIMCVNNAFYWEMVHGLPASGLAISGCSNSLSDL